MTNKIQILENKIKSYEIAVKTSKNSIHMVKLDKNSKLNNSCVSNKSTSNLHIGKFNNQAKPNKNIFFNLEVSKQINDKPVVKTKTHFNNLFSKQNSPKSKEIV